MRQKSDHEGAPHFQVAGAHALGKPVAVVVLVFNANLAEMTVSDVYFLAFYDLALAAILVLAVHTYLVLRFYLLYGFDTIQIDFVVDVDVSRAQAGIGE